MGIQSQLRKSIVANALVSIFLIAIVILAILTVFLATYQNTMSSRLAELIQSYGIRREEVQELMKVGIGELIYGGSRFPLIPIFGIVAALIVVSVSALFSRITSRVILVPLKELETAANHIAEGDLDYKISYDSDNEFESVKDAFNEMQVKLKELVYENLKQEQSKKELIAGISHDLRTPLTSIKGYVRGMQDGVASTPEKLYRYLDTISAKTTEMEVMIDKLLEFSKIDAGEVYLRLERVDMTEFLRGYLRTVSEDMRQRGLEVTYSPRDLDSKSSVLVDFDEMSRVFSNILENSAKYRTKERGHATIDSYQMNDSYMIEISDDGPGVPKEQLDRVFDTFYRGDPSRASNIKGSGLGLAIADRIIKAHGGEIFAEMRDRFTIVIRLPLSEGERGGFDEKDTDR